MIKGIKLIKTAPFKTNQLEITNKNNNFSNLFREKKNYFFVLVFLAKSNIYC